jgi:autotransporter-associated beta strand protein
VGQVKIVEGAQITLNPSTIPMTVASANGYTSYPNTSNLTLGGTATGNVITGPISATNPPGSAFSQPINVVKSGANDWTIAGVFSSGGVTIYGGTLRLNGANSYAGVTTVQSGILIAGTNAPNNANGAFGKVNNGEVILGVAGGTSDASILTSGPYNIGRPIRIVTTNNTDYGARVLTIGGNTAHSSVISGAIYVGTASNAGHGITLTAASGGSVNFSGVIQNPTGMDLSYYTVTKAGAGTVLFSNSNTYTGSTLVSEGTLELTGATQATNSITFNSGAKLGFTIGSPVTAASAAVNLTNGTVKITGTPVNPSHTLLTAASITGAPVLAAAIPGYELQIVGNQLQLNQVVTDPYAAWSAGAAFDVDTNKDGIDNGLAWLLGASDKNIGALNKLPASSPNGNMLRLTFRCLKSDKRGTAQIKVQSSNDLGVSDPWTSHEAAVPDADSTVNGVVFDTTADGDYINVIADIPTPGFGLFARLSAVYVP